MAHKEAVVPPATTPGVAVPNRKNEAVLNGESVFEGDTAIQDAINSASTGDHIAVGPGTFTDNVTVDVDNLSIIASGRGTVIDGGATGSNALAIAATGVHVTALAVKTSPGGPDTDTFGTAAGAGGATVSNVTVIDADVNAFLFSHGSDHTVSECRVKSCGDDAFQAETPRVSFDNCFAESGVAGEAFNLNATKCKVDGGFSRQPGNRGVLVSGDDCLVTDHLVDNAGSDGILIDNGISDSEVSDCRIVAPTGDGVHDQGSTDVLMSGVFVTGAGGQAFNTGSATTPKIRDCVPESANNIAGQTRVDLLVDSPNGHIPNAALDDGDSAEISVPVPNGETLKVYRWGAYKISDGTAPTDLDVELLDGSDTVDATANTNNNESTDPTSPVASSTNSSGSLSIFKLAVANDTGSTISDPGVGAHFGYLVE